MENKSAKFSPRKTSTRRNCCVPQCSSVACLNPELRFHCFPREGEFVYLLNKLNIREKCDRRKAWTRALKIGKLISNNMFVCSRHFLKADYILPDVPAKIRYLKRTAVPSPNLPRTSTDGRILVERSDVGNKRSRHRSADLMLQKVIDQPCVQDTEDNENEERLFVLEEKESQDSSTVIAAAALMSLSTSTVPTVITAEIEVQCSVDMKDFSCQVSSGDLKSSFVDLINSTSRLTTFTGIDSFQKWTTLILIFIELFPSTNRNSLDSKSKIMMTFMKLKLNWSFAVLATLFSVTPTTCKNTFVQCIKALFSIMKSMIVWPSKEEILKNLPMCFDNFRKVRVVLDCTEVRISKFKCLKCRILSYSHYKGGHTIKFMVGVTPAGVISFVSRGYGGRASDKKIFEESGIINQLEPSVDDVMVDKGFLVKSICEANCIGVIHPPFLRKNIKFNRVDALATSSIAKARVHVERVIERIKKFKILTESFSATLLHLADEVMVIACGMTNLSNPVLADDKFI